LIRWVSPKVDIVKTVRVIVVRIVPTLTRDLVSRAVGNQTLVSNLVSFNFKISQAEKTIVSAQNQNKLVRVTGL
jgi:hypothetical protein